MANKVRIKVILKRVHVLRDSDAVGSGEFYFKATVDGKAVGDRQVFNAVKGRTINLPQPKWSAIVEVTNKNSVVVFFEVKEEDRFRDDELGSFRYTLRAPWTERDFRTSNNYFILEWGVEIELGGSFGRHAPGEVYACREHNGSLSCTTISGAVIPARMEFHPVIPVPPKASRPPRPPLPSGTPELAVNGPINGGTNVTTASDVNVIPNPPVIPILTAAEANAQTAAKIEFTYYRPNTLKFTDNDARLEWSVVPINGGAVSFVGQPRGLKVKVYGTAAGEVRLEVRFRGALFATYRALVLPLKQITCRFNILNGPTATSQPRATPTDVQNHLTIANRYLRQMALELVLDTNPTRTNGATATTIPGIFRIRVSRGTTRRTNAVTATRLNFRAGVMNFAYIHSDDATIFRTDAAGNFVLDAAGNRIIDFQSNLGAATDFPHSTIAPAAAGGRPTLTDSGTPSDGWALPSGVPPDAAAATVTLTLIRGIPRAGFPQLFAMYVTDAHGDPTDPAIQQNFANTIIHELYHILNLGHRVEGPDQNGVTAANPTGLAANGIFFDGLTHPPDENLMHFNNPGNIAQDIDILQTRAARRSPLVPGPVDPV